jgi:hypothetical protein
MLRWNIVPNTAESLEINVHKELSKYLILKFRFIRCYLPAIALWKFASSIRRE